MDPISGLMFLSAGLSTAGQGLGFLSEMGQNRRMKRANLLKQFSLQGDLAVVNAKQSFEQSRTIDQLDTAQGAATANFAGGNIDPTEGAPAFQQLMNAAQADTDIKLIAARGAQARADIYGQMADSAGKKADSDRALGWSAATRMLNVASTWTNLAGQGAKMGLFGGSGSAGSSPLAIGKAGGNGWGFGATGWLE
jgi:hypothetical protein